MPHEDGAIRTALPKWVVRKCNPLEARTGRIDRDVFGPFFAAVQFEHRALGLEESDAFQTVLAREAEVSTVVEGVLMGPGTSASVTEGAGVAGA